MSTASDRSEVVEGRRPRAGQINLVKRKIESGDGLRKADADLHVFGECGHWVQIERMASFNRIVTEFFKKGLKA